MCVLPEPERAKTCKDAVTIEFWGVGLCDGSGWCSLSQLELPVAAKGSGRDNSPGNSVNVLAGAKRQAQPRTELLRSE